MTIYKIYCASKEKTRAETLHAFDLREKVFVCLDSDTSKCNLSYRQLLFHALLTLNTAFQAPKWRLYVSHCQLNVQVSNQTTGKTIFLTNNSFLISYHFHLGHTLPSVFHSLITQPSAFAPPSPSCSHSLGSSLSCLWWLLRMVSEESEMSERNEGNMILPPWYGILDRGRGCSGYRDGTASKECWSGRVLE